MNRRARAILRIGVVAGLIPIGVATSPGSVVADTINVVAGDASSLRAAVSAAVSGDIVAIPAGEYELDCPFAEEQNNTSGDLDIVNKSITLRGPATGTAIVRPAAGCNERIIDVIDFSDPADSVTIERLTLTGGRPSGGGGGINAAFSQPTTLTILDSIITDNIAGDAGASTAPSGGGVFLGNAGNLVIERSTISGNSVGLGGDIGSGPVRGWGAGGGGVAFRGSTTATPGSVTITDSTISGNVGGVASLGGGGGLWLETDVVTLTDVDVVDNTLPADPSGRASGDGAGVAITGRTPLLDMSVAITGGSISGNTIGRPATNAATGSTADGGNGGGLYIDSVLSGYETTGSVVVDGTTFDGNEAGAGAIQAGGTGRGGSGGNIYIQSSSTSSIDPLAVTITGAQVRNGRAGDGSASGRGGGIGGGATITTGNFDMGGTISITDTVFSRNHAGLAESDGEGGYGGGLAAWSTTGNVAGLITVTGSTFTDNRAGPGATASSGDAGGQGGGAHLRVSGSLSGSAPVVVVQTSTFTGNAAGAGGTGSAAPGGLGGAGGGAVLDAQRTLIDDSTFTGNEAGDGGSGTAGSRGGSGGAVRIVANDAVVTGSSFVQNSSGSGGEGTGGSGGAGGGGGAVVFDTFASVSLATSDFSGNDSGSGGSGGAGAGAGGWGGAVYVDNGGTGSVDVSDATFEGNNAGDGGSASTGAAQSGGFGGGLAIRGANDRTTSIDLDTVTAVGNASGDAGTGLTATSAFGGRGGGVYVAAADVSSSLGVIDSVIADNTTGDGGTATGAGNGAWPAGAGGGLYADIGDFAAGSSDAATITVTSSSVTGNRTGTGGTAGPGSTAHGRGGEGGGLWLSGGDGNGGLVSIANSTIADNETGDGGSAAGGGTGDGGGVSVSGTTVAEFIYNTVTGNIGGSGVNLLTDTTSTTFDANVIGQPGTGNNGENCRIVNTGSVSSLGYNVETERDDCELTDPTDIVDLDEIVLGPLQDNGGIGLSRLPLIIGPDPLPVFDRVPEPCGNSLDQHGTARPQGAGCDVGAVEAQLGSIEAVDDVIRVGGGTTTLNFLDNDDLLGFTPADARATITTQNSADQIEEDGGTWTFRSRSGTGEFTSFTYEVCLGPTDQFCDTAEVTLIPDGTSRFVALSPNRLFDTRPTEPGNGPKGFVPADSEIDVQITGVAGVPSTGVSAVAMNVTATQVEGPGFVTAYAKGEQRPVSSNLNFTTPGDTIANFVIVPVGDGGKVTLYTLSGTHLLADVAGYFTENGVSTSAAAPGSTSGRLIPITPTRVFDTRPDQPASGPKGLVAADSTIEVQIAGRAGVPTSGASAVVMNLTATDTTAPGFVAAYPTGGALPTASNVNITGPGQTAPNLVIVPLGDDGKISLYTLSSLHLLGDVTGYITTSGAPRSLSGLFNPARPQRAFDSREGEVPPGSKGFFADDETRGVRFTANAGTPAEGAGAVMINATATGAAAPGFVTAWPDGEDRPIASTLNLSFPGQTRPNAAILPIGAGGRINFYSLRGVDLLADVFGWFLE